MARLLVARLNSEDEIVDFIDGTYAYKRNTVLERYLSKGTYMILA